MDNQNPFSSKKSFSLGLRVFFLCFIFIYVPFFYLNIKEYFDDYQAKKEDVMLQVEEAYNLLQKEIEDVSLLQRSILDFISPSLSLSQAQEDKSILILRVKKDKDQYICRESTSKNWVGKNFSQFIDPYEERSFSFLDTKTTNVPYFFQGKITSNGILLAGVPVSFLFQKQRSAFAYFLMEEDSVIESNYKQNEETLTFGEEGEFFLNEDKFIGKKFFFPNSEEILVIGYFAQEKDLVDFNKNLRSQLLLFFLLLSLSGFVAYLLTLKMSYPFHRLIDVMKEVSLGKTQKKYEESSFGFEVNQIGQAFNQTIENLLQKENELKEQTVEKETYLKELHIGRDIQKKLISFSSTEHLNMDMAFTFLPAKQVSGDFFDFYPIDLENYLIVIADSADKGISACLYSLTLRSLLRSSMKGRSFQEALSLASHIFYQDAIKEGMFVTLWVGIYHHPSKKLTYSCNGHPPALLKRKGGILPLSSSGIPFGIEENQKIETKEIILEKEDSLFLFTDGLMEMQSGEKPLSMQNISDMFLENRGRNAMEIKAQWLRKIEKGDLARLVDDISFAVFVFG